MRRGDVATVMLPGGLGKPRPAVVVQIDLLNAKLPGTIVCPLTTDLENVSRLRVTLDPTPRNGLQHRSQVMVDKITAVPQAKVGGRIGRLDDPELAAVNRALMIVLGLP